MISVTLQDLINAKGYTTLRAEIIGLLKTYGYSATDWQTISESSAFVNVESKTLEELWLMLAEVTKGRYLDTATGGWLTLLAYSNYQVERLAAEYTRGVATFTLIGNGTRTISAGSLIVTDGLGHTYVTDNAAPINLTPANRVAEVPIVAQEIGSNSNVAPGVITKIYTGANNVSVINQGLPTAATVLGINGLLAPLTGPFNLAGKNIQINYDALDFSGNIYTGLFSYAFTLNYATMTDVVNLLNSLGSFNANLLAENDVGFLRITSKYKGPKATVDVKSTGTANGLLGFSTVSDTKSYGGYTTDYPAVVYSAYLVPPFNVNGLTLSFTYIDGVVTTTFPINFGANYPDLQSLINDNQAQFVSKNLRIYSDNNRLAIRTIKSGSDQVLIVNTTGSANIFFGFSLDALNPTKANGYSSWITTYGRDEESDDSVRSRCKKKFAITGMGTRDAFETWVREATPNVSKVAIYSNELNGVPKAGAVTIYLASLNGGVDAATVAAVYNYILPKMPIMSDLYVGSVNVITVTYSGTLIIKLDAATTENLTKVKNAFTKYAQTLTIGSPIKREALIAAIYQQFNINDVNAVVLATPVGPITTCQKNEIIVLQEDPINKLVIIPV